MTGFSKLRLSVSLDFSICLRSFLINLCNSCLGNTRCNSGSNSSSGEDIGAAVVYLASKEAGYVTGQTLHVNGGMAMI